MSSAPGAWIVRPEVAAPSPDRGVRLRGRLAATAPSRWVGIGLARRSVRQADS